MAFSYEDWVQKLKKELRSDDLTSKHQILQNGIHFDPFIVSSQSELIELTYPKNFKIGYTITVDSEEKANTQIKDLLENGLGLIRILAKTNTNWGLLFEGIYLEMLSLDIVLPSDDELNRFNLFRDTQVQHKEWQVTLRTPNQSFGVLDFTNTELDNQSSILQHLKAQLENNNDVKRVCVDTYDNLLLSIPFLRAIKHISHTNDAPILEANYRIQPDEIHDLIKITNAAMWARIGGANQFFVYDPSEENLSRLILNIQHLMDFESKMDISEDPLAGAYVIEDLTKKLLSQI